MDIRPIRTHDDHRAALEEIDRLWGAEPGTPDADRLDVLVVLVEHFEDAAFPIAPARPLDVLKFCMAENGRTQSELAALIGSRSRASEILSGKRDLSLDHIRLLSKHWHIPAGALVGELEPA